MEDDADHNKSINTNKCDENHNPNNSKIQIACRLNEFRMAEMPKGWFDNDAVMDGQFLTGEDKTFKHESLILAQDERWRRA